MIRRTAATLASAVALLAATAAPALAQTDKFLDKAAVERIVRDYLLANPEVLVEAMHVLSARNKEASAKAQVEAIRANRAELLERKTSPVGGNPEGDVTLVEFFDYNCGFCKRANPERNKAVAEDGKVRVVFKEFPILGPVSVIASRAALAARGQGKYVEFHEALFDHQGPLSESAVMDIARSVKLDVKRLKKDMEDPAVMEEIQANVELAKKLGIQGTPGFIVGDTLIPGAIDAAAFAQHFQAARAAAGDGKATAGGAGGKQ